ncbi:MAG: hypothetical protein E6R03_00120 [Hyphomicrobiaceae bacterium]|nr:MAG: hypothetical protein E6R03_00120 [Hyphomicrobiaceae bacterium]
MDILVIGGGLTGHLVQRVLPDALILDWNSPAAVPTVPKMWGAQYLWHPIGGWAHTSCLVHTSIDGHPATPESILKYKTAIGKGVEVISRPDAVAAQFQPEMTGYMLDEIPRPTNIQYQCHVVAVDLDRQRVVTRNGGSYAYDVLVSSIPLPALLRMARPIYPRIPSFRARAVYVMEHTEPHATVGEGFLHVNYLTSSPVYRETTRHTGRVHRETLSSDYAMMAAKKLVPGKIWDEPDTPFILDWLRDHNVYCFGRYARWDSDELLHQTDADIRAWSANDLNR